MPAAMFWKRDTTDSVATPSRKLAYAAALGFEGPTEFVKRS